MTVSTQLQNEECYRAPHVHTKNLTPLSVELKYSLHGELWYKDLPAAEIAHMLAVQLRALKAARNEGATLRAACTMYRNCLESAAKDAVVPEEPVVYGSQTSTTWLCSNPIGFVMPQLGFLEAGTVARIICKLMCESRKNRAVFNLMPSA